MTHRDFFFVLKSRIAESGQCSSEFIKMGFDKESSAFDWVDVHLVSPGAL